MDKTKEMIAHAYEARDEIVLCLIGSPGIGKTQAVYEFAKEKNVRVVEIIASQILPNEVSGITMPVNDSKSMEIFDHARLASLQDGDILFFDELLQAAPSTLSACLTLIQERRLMSGKELPDIMIIAATNPLPGGISRVPEAIRQRFMWYECEWSVDKWVEYIKDTFFCTPTERLKSLIASAVTNITNSKNRMNILTPRSAAKLIRWYKSNPEVFGTISNIWGDDIATEIQRSCLNHEMALNDLKKTVEDIADRHKINLPIDIKNINDAYSMVTMLMSTPAWTIFERELEMKNA